MATLPSVARHDNLTKFIAFIVVNLYKKLFDLILRT